MNFKEYKTLLSVPNQILTAENYQNIRKFSAKLDSIFRKKLENASFVLLIAINYI
jgi:hypothetical protein